MTTDKKEWIKKCTDCVNYIYGENKTKVLCDMDYWGETVISKSNIFVPELFDCIDYES